MVSVFIDTLLNMYIFPSYNQIQADIHVLQREFLSCEVYFIINPVKRQTVSGKITVKSQRNHLDKDYRKLFYIRGKQWKLYR